MAPRETAGPPPTILNHQPRAWGVGAGGRARAHTPGESTRKETPMTTRMQMWSMALTAVATGIQAVVLLAVSWHWWALLMGTMSAINAAGVVAAIVNQRREQQQEEDPQ